MKIHEKKAIKDWAIDDRPREKLAEKGKASLSNVELLAILIGSGNSKESAIELSQRILATANNNLLTLSKFTVQDLIRQFKGIGLAKAVTIISALELGGRRIVSKAEERSKVSSSKDAYELFYENLADLNHEECWVVYLSTAKTVLKKECISSGGLSSNIVDIRKVFKLAFEQNATSIIIAHNHPSGAVKPSKEDIVMTQRLKKAGEILNIPLLDHIVIGDNVYYSFSDNGNL